MTGEQMSGTRAEVTDGNSRRDHGMPLSHSSHRRPHSTCHPACFAGKARVPSLFCAPTVLRSPSGNHRHSTAAACRTSAWSTRRMSWVCSTSPSTASLSLILLHPSTHARVPLGHTRVEDHWGGFGRSRRTGRPWSVVTRLLSLEHVYTVPCQ